MNKSVYDHGSEIDMQTELFLQLAEAVGTSARTGPVLALACERLATILGCTRTSVFLVEDGQPVPRMSRFADGVSRPDQWERFHTTLNVDPPPIVVEVLARGEPVVHSEYGANWWSQSFDIASALGVPIGKSSHPLGVLVADCREHYDFRPEQVRLARAIGVQLGGIVALVQQIEQQRTRLDLAEAARQLSNEGSLAASTLGVAEVLARVASGALGSPSTWSIALDSTDSVIAVAATGVDAVKVEAVRFALMGKPFSSTGLGRVIGSNRVPALIKDINPGGGADDDLAFFGLRSGWCIPVVCPLGRIVAAVVIGDSSIHGHVGHRDRMLVNFLAQESTLVAENVTLRARDHYQATHDSLTGLANRSAFEDHLSRALVVAGRTSEPLAVLLLDLNRFKEVNDTVGHRMGDQLLIEVGRRLSSVMREADLIARLGGDEFVILLATSADECGARTAAERIVGALDRPLVVADRSIWIGASVGIACFPQHGSDPQTLLHRADLAMYEAKRTTVGVVIYDACVDRARSEIPGLLLELPRAIQGNELVVHYQPKLDLSSHEVVGVEALVRWVHPTMGLLSPDQFIPLAEATGLIRQLTSWVLATALRQVASWRSSGRSLSVAVNISARDLADSTLPKRVAIALAEAGVPAGQLTLELTESAIMADEAKGTEVLTRLRALGVRISLDDFGTGYSSLAYLERLPLDEVKIDRSFLVDGQGSESFVVRSMTNMGHHLGLQIVVEGVERWVSYESMARIGCDEMQGYALSPPLALDEFELWLDGWSSEDLDESLGLRDQVE
ncbi:MAG: EAL domain-containing protein [Ferrimicrobium sp.]